MTKWSKDAGRGHSANIIFGHHHLDRQRDKVTTVNMFIIDANVSELLVQIFISFFYAFAKRDA